MATGGVVMAWQTINGTTAATAGTSGLKEFASGDTIGATDLLRDMKDPQDAHSYGHVVGVLSGGVCTASGLTVTIPSGTLVLCRSVWQASGAQTQAVTDNATSYVWLCADGETRITSSTTPPASYDERTAAILCRTVAASGTAVVDLSVQQRARSSTTTRFVGEGSAWFAGTADTIPDGGWAECPDGTQVRLMDYLTVTGTLRVSGKVKVE